MFTLIRLMIMWSAATLFFVFVLHEESNIRQKIKIKSNVTFKTRPVEELMAMKVLQLIPSAPHSSG